ncbi:uncharacterized protein LOC144308331 [Canis aureus]
MSTGRVRHPVFLGWDQNASPRNIPRGQHYMVIQMGPKGGEPQRNQQPPESCKVPTSLPCAICFLHSPETKTSNITVQRFHLLEKISPERPSSTLLERPLSDLTS